jgi:hypothetical protein
MMNLDQSRAGEGILSPPKETKKSGGDDVSSAPGPTEPVFSGEEKDLNIEIPQGWKVQGK